MTRYIIVEWPYSQELMDYEDFDEHACLINDDSWVEQYGNASYFVEEEWLNQIKNGNNI